MKIKNIFIVSAVLAASFVFAGENDYDAQPKATVSGKTLLRSSPMRKPPVIDGRIEYKEWNDASASFGGISDKSKMMTPRETTFIFGYDNENVYFAVDSVAPTAPQKLTDQDTVELTLLPPDATKPFVFRLNSKGEGDLPQGAKAANTIMLELDKGITEDHWKTEMSIPLAALGIKALKDGEAWGLQMARNWRNKDENGLWHLPTTAGETGAFIPDSKAPTVSLDNFGHMLYAATANYIFTFRVENNTSGNLNLESKSAMTAEAISVATLAPSDTSGFIKEKKTIRIGSGFSIAPGKSVPIEQLCWAQFPGTTRTLVGYFTSADGKTEYYKRAFQWDLSSALNLDLYDSIGLPKLESAFYPSFGNKLLVRVSSAKPDTTKDYKSVTVTVKDSKGKDVATIKPEYIAAQKVHEKQIELPNLPLDDYTVNMEAVASDGKVFTDKRTFSVRKFDWQGTDLGMERVIIPPFKPLQVDKAKNEVHALMTGFKVGGTLWDAIYSEGENIMTGPVELVINGEKFKTDAIRLVSQEKDRVVYELDASWKGMKLAVVQDYDYDGFCKATFKLAPNGATEIKEFYLTIPMKRQYAQFHNMMIHPREAPESYEIPQGNGEVWNSSMWKGSNSYPGGWTPYCWFGGIYKGFCWLSDSIRGWSLDQKKPCMHFLRTDDTVSLRLDIVNKPTTWNKPFEIEMGFQATPVKPQVKGFAKFGSQMYAYPPPKNSEQRAMHGEWGLRQGVFNPPEGDFSFHDYFMANQGKPVDKEALQKVADEYIERHKGYWAKYNLGTVDSHKYPLYSAWREMQAKHHLFYTDPLAISCFWPEDEMYKAEWSAWVYPPKDHFYFEYLCRLPKSRLDKLVHDARRAVRRGYQGVNFDCFSQGGGFNTMTHVAYVAEDGSVQSNSDLLQWRSLVKRMATMLYVENKLKFGVPWVDVHSSTGAVVPVLSFATTTITWEMRGGLGEYQNRFPESQILADTIGTQAGVMPWPIVSTCGKNPEREAITMLSMLLGYSLMNITDQGVTGGYPFFQQAMDTIFEFGYGDADVDILPFWGSRKQSVTHDGKDVRMTVLTRTGKALLMVGNQAKKTTVTFDVSGLGYKSYAIKDAVTGRTLGTGQKVTIGIPERDYVLLLVEAGQ